MRFDHVVFGRTNGLDLDDYLRIAGIAPEDVMMNYTVVLRLSDEINIKEPSMRALSRPDDFFDESGYPLVYNMVNEGWLGVPASIEDLNSLFDALKMVSNLPFVIELYRLEEIHKAAIGEPHDEKIRVHHLKPEDADKYKAKKQRIIEIAKANRQQEVLIARKRLGSSKKRKKEETTIPDVFTPERRDRKFRKPGDAITREELPFQEVISVTKTGLVRLVHGRAAVVYDVKERKDGSIWVKVKVGNKFRWKKAKNR